MQRRRKRREFDQFPVAPITKVEAIEDAKNMEYMSKFRDYHVRTVFYLALLGMTEEQMAVVLDISFSCFNQWKVKHPTFRESIREGKEQADAKMVYSLYQAGIGYEHDDEQVFMTKEKIYGTDDRGRTVLMKETPKVIRVPVRKHYPPNVRAAMRWLEIRQPAVWSQKQDQKSKLTLVQNNTYNVAELSMEELKVLQKLGLQNTPQDGQQFHTTAQQELKNLETINI